MSEVVQRVPNPELFFCIVSPIGTNVQTTIDSLSEKLKQYDYTPVVIRVTDIFPVLQDYLKFPVKLQEVPLEDRYGSYIEFGDLLREHFDDDSFLASTTVSRIANKRQEVVAREELGNPQKIAYIIRQFKRKEELELLRSVYGPLLFQLSVYSKRSSRVDNLARMIAASHDSADVNSYRNEAEHLVSRDENEADDIHGQRVSDVFHEADFIVNTDLVEDTVEEQVYRFVNLLFGSNGISPTRAEYGMYTAKSASLRTLDLSRQVGAAIFSPEGEIISIGTNEVPKAKGGTYWSDGKYDDRDYKRLVDSNEKRKKELLSELVKLISPDADLDSVLKDRGVRKSQFMDALEYGRIIHAEMSAVCDSARLGRPLKNSVLYCTTFPCHMCAKHIVAAGVCEVVFLEPYPKSLASELHGDSIEIEGQSRGDYSEFPATKFKHFHGVSPKRYRDLFERKRRKDATGRFEPWKGNQRQVIVDVKLPVYLRLEEYILQAVLVPSLRKAGVPPRALMPANSPAESRRKQATAKRSSARQPKKSKR
jgi:deoxycytidylate deaminase